VRVGGKGACRIERTQGWFREKVASLRATSQTRGSHFAMVKKKRRELKTSIEQRGEENSMSSKHNCGSDPEKTGGIEFWGKIGVPDLCCKGGGGIVGAKFVWATTAARPKLKKD